MNADPDHLAAAQHFFSSLMGPPFLFATGIENSNPAIHVGNEAVVEATVAEALKRFSRPDVVVNNAGLIEFKPLEELTGAD